MLTVVNSWRKSPPTTLAKVAKAARRQLHLRASFFKRDESARMASTPNQIAVRLMLGYVFLTSFTPTLISYGGGDSPFAYTVAWKIAGLSLCVVALPLISRRLFFNRETWRIAISHALSPAMLAWTASSLDVALYAWSTRYVNAAVSASIYETHAMTVAMLTGFLFRREARYAKMNALSLALFAAAIVGVSAVIASQSNGVALDSPGAADLAKGVSLAFGSVLLASLGAFGFRWASRFSDDLNADERERPRMFGVAVGISVHTTLVSSLSAAAALILGEKFSRRALSFGAADGAASTAGAVCWRAAILTTNRLEVNAMSYLTPAVALAWLFAFGRVSTVNATMLLSGFALIAASNALALLLTRREAERSRFA